MAQFSKGTYIPSRPQYVLHVVGPNGAAKDRFIVEYFPSLPLFDLSAVLPDFHAQYSEDLAINTDDREADPQIGEFETQLLQKWADFLRASDPTTKNPDDHTSPFVVLVNSSGKNDPLTGLLVWYFPTNLLVVKDEMDLQAVKPTVYHTRVYNQTTGVFSGVLDAPFINASPRLSQARNVKKISLAVFDE